MPRPLPQNWAAFLFALDAAMTEPAQLDCIGGFVVTQVFGFERETMDIDVVEIAPLRERKDVLDIAGKGSELSRRTKHYIDFVGVSSLPEDYVSRLIEIYPGQYKNIRLMAVDPYDIVLSKLERDSPKDRLDVIHLAVSVPLDLDLLRDRYQTELRWMLTGDPRWTDDRLDLWIGMMRDAQSKRTP